MTKSYKLLSGFLIAWLLVGSTYGQEARNFPALTVIPPSPEAANLGRYAASPISFYTGTPQISVPLTELTVGPLKLPLTLSYNASGNRVEDVASWVGLGWALNAGGVITRAVRGTADDQQPSGPNAPFTNFFDVTRNYTQPQLDTASLNSLYQGVGTQLLVRAARGCADVQPDIFYFNFNGYTGQFSFDWNRRLIINSAKDLRVEPIFTQDVITSWRVTTEDGTVYLFANAEYTTSRPKTFNVANCSPAQGQRFISSWYISSITDVNHEHQLTFTYDGYALQYNLRFTDALENGIGDCPDITDVGVNRSSQSYSTISGIRPRRICASNGADTIATVELVPATTERTDTVGLTASYRSNFKALDHLILRDGTGREVKTIFLSFYPANPTGRLTLWQVQQGRLSGSRLPGHQFSYMRWSS